MAKRMRESGSDTAAFFGEGTRFVGDFSGRGNIVMCGAIEGDCNLDGPVTLTEHGHWRGTIRATDVIIRGTVEGNVIATGNLEIAPTAVIRGNVAGATVSIAKGAIVHGAMDMTGATVDNLVEA